MHLNMAGTFSDYVLRAIRAGSSMPPLVARVAYAVALLIAVPIAVVAFLLTLGGAALLLTMARLRRDEKPARHEGPVVIEGEYTVVDDARTRDDEPARRVTTER
jgi:hypothetical protein